MHQWWGDNVSEDEYERTFFKEGYADLSEGFNTARTAANAAGGLGTPAVTRRSSSSLVTRFNTTYNSTNAANWNVAPSNPTNANLFGSQHLHPLRAARYIALRQILGGQLHPGAKEIQTTYGGGSITEPQLERTSTSGCRTRARLRHKLDEFFKQWWDTAYPPAAAATSRTSRVPAWPARASTRGAAPGDARPPGTGFPAAGPVRPAAAAAPPGHARPGCHDEADHS